jgi:hypothetical protein
MKQIVWHTINSDLNRHALSSVKFLYSPVILAIGNTLNFVVGTPEFVVVELAQLVS